MKKTIKKLLKKFIYPLLKTRERFKRSICSKPPKRISIEITNMCNSRCSYCPKSLGIDRPQGKMPLNNFYILVKNLKEYSFDQIDFCGFGEALVHEDWYEMAKIMFDNLNFRRSFFTTNGILLNEETIKRLTQIPFDAVTISLNAVSQSKYLEINRADKYECLIKNINNLIQYLKRENSVNKVKIYYIQLLSDVQKEEEINDFIRSHQGWIENIPVRFSVVTFSNWGGMIGGPALWKRKRYPCAHLYVPGIAWNGDVYACCIALADGDKELYLGNIFKENFQSLYHSEKFHKLHCANLNGNLGIFANKCKKCNGWCRIDNIFFKTPFIKRWV